MRKLRLEYGDPPPRKREPEPDNPDEPDQDKGKDK
jgi:hypothetical protein